MFYIYIYVLHSPSICVCVCGTFVPYGTYSKYDVRTMSGPKRPTLLMLTTQTVNFEISVLGELGIKDLHVLDQVAI